MNADEKLDVWYWIVAIIISLVLLSWISAAVQGHALSRIEQLEKAVEIYHHR